MRRAHLAAPGGYLEAWNDMSVSGGVSTAKGWRARWYLWDGGFLAMGRSPGSATEAEREPAATGSHSHHAIQITIGLDGPVALRPPEGPWQTGAGMIVAPDEEHRFAPMGALLAILFVDPEAKEGRWLRRSLQGPLTEVPAARLEPVVSTLRALWEEPTQVDETARIIHSIVRALCAGPPPPPHLLDSRIVRALEVIREMDSSRIALEEVARAVFLSPSRFAHLFTEEVGLPFRRYVLWRRLTRAMLAVGNGSTLSAAAHACGFADAAHLTRACTQMLGQPPSLLMRPGEFYEIPAPFELPVSTPRSVAP